MHHGTTTYAMVFIKRFVFNLQVLERNERALASKIHDDNYRNVSEYFDR